MPDQPQTDRTDEARRTDDHELIEDAERAPSFQGEQVGLHGDIATRDDERAEIAGETHTPVQGGDKVQPFLPTRADNEGANG
jgi:hypothetical protein